MVRQILKTYIWIGPDRFVPPIGDMRKGKPCTMPEEMADKFKAKGWLKDSKPKGSKGGKSSSKTIKMVDNIGIGDSGR